MLEKETEKKLWRIINKQELTYMYTKNVGHQHNRWIELKEALRVQTHAEV
jgi:hypothetical protein